MKWPGVHRVAISEPDNPVNSATAGQMNGFPFSFSQRAAASSPRTLKISSVTGSGTAKVSASEETRSINPALASKMTGEALMTRIQTPFNSSASSSGVYWNGVTLCRNSKSRNSARATPKRHSEPTPLQAQP
jgi:hypothetical protein